MRKLSITVIHDPGTRDSRGVERRDIAIDQVVAALQSKGHRADTFAIPADIESFVSGLLSRSPDVVYNLGESFGDNMQQDFNIAAILEVMGIPFTGAGTGGLYLSQDKVLTKKLLHFHGVKYPEFITLAPDHIETGGRIGFPLFVKPVRADASIGIHAASLVHNFKSLIERVQYVHESVGCEALAEEYIKGREYYLGVIGHLDPQVLSVIEMDFSGLPPNAVPVASFEAKWKVRTRAYKGTKSVIATNISPELQSRLKMAAREAFLAMRLRDYGRIDVRVSEDNQVYVIDVNPNPYLARDSEFAMAAWDCGIPYEDLVEHMVEWAWKRRRERPPGITEVLAATAAGSGRVTAANPLYSSREQKSERPAKVIAAAAAPAPTSTPHAAPVPPVAPVSPVEPGETGKIGSGSG